MPRDNNHADRKWHDGTVPDEALKDIVAQCFQFHVGIRLPLLVSEGVSEDRFQASRQSTAVPRM